MLFSFIGVSKCVPKKFEHFHVDQSSSNQTQSWQISPIL